MRLEFSGSLASPKSLASRRVGIVPFSKLGYADPPATYGDSRRYEKNRSMARKGGGRSPTRFGCHSRQRTRVSDLGVVVPKREPCPVTSRTKDRVLGRESHSNEARRAAAVTSPDTGPASDTQPRERRGSGSPTARAESSALFPGLT
jgi:hypothetical protein